MLDAACRIFASHHFDTVSLDAVAREAGVTKRTIYEIFGDKAALFRAVCNFSSASVANLQFAKVVPGAGCRDVLLLLARTLLEHAMEPSRIALSRMITVESQRFPDLVKEVLVIGKQHMDRAIIGIFEDMERHGIATVPDHELAAELFYDIIVGNQGFRATIGFDEPAMPEPVLHRRLDVFIRGYISAEN